ncbi:N-acetylneuraminate synthase family protein [Prochlorococcus marinus]|uniref:Sialic acid synthase n=1 Tax=Prochlorococcus marinus (strain AS9601) TaxID=146891 RepID=A2BSE7_PROMS|nr:N-acetylneuraminate synthase family protein [Prochlorococcus marinus]ABM70708.1 Sialic acid synthase [Prochlorococcus marinus str. AS9601]
MLKNQNFDSYSRIFNRKLEEGIIIAEIGVNHGGDIDKAIAMIDDVKNNGGDAVKFQTYKANLIARKDSKAYWDTTKEKTMSQFELFSKYDKFGLEEFKKIEDYCKRKSVLFMSTPFDSYSANYINQLSKIHKVASVDITNHILISQLASYGKDIILSTGASNLDEIKAAVSLIESKSKISPALLHCVVNYPTLDKDANLLRIKKLKESFPENIIGYSDHTLPDKNMIVCTQAYNYGALIIEKHFTYDKKIQGNDHYHSMNANDLKILRTNISKAYSLQGKGNIKPMENEKSSILHARRSLTSKFLIKKGSILSKEMIIPKRPGNGICPSKIEEVLGRKVKKEIKEDSPINWEDLEI